MRLGIILSILIVPICAQATLCEQYMTIRDYLKEGHATAAEELKSRSRLDRFRDWLARTPQPEAVLVLANNAVTKALESHFDNMIQVDSNHVRLERYPNEERKKYEEIGRYETTSFVKLIPTHYAIHLTAAGDRPAYLQGRIVQILSNGFDFLDSKTRQVFRVSETEFVSAKMADVGDYYGKNPVVFQKGNPDSVWEQSSTVGVIDTLKAHMNSAARFILQINDGSAYGVSGFHKLVVRHMEDLQFGDKGIYIPELNITVPTNEVVAVTAS